MSRATGVHHKFVDVIPDQLDDATIYVSIQYATSVHKCLCGCGNEVVTPLSPTDWRLTFDGETISLCPSIGNWSFPCQSHYWIEQDSVRWAPRWNKKQIEAGRRRARETKQHHRAQPQASPLAARSPSLIERVLRKVARRR